jgi:hypothetical protein
VGREVFDQVHSDTVPGPTDMRAHGARRQLIYWLIRTTRGPVRLLALL